MINPWFGLVQVLACLTSSRAENQSIFCLRTKYPITTVGARLTWKKYQFHLEYFQNAGKKIMLLDRVSTQECIFLRINPPPPLEMKYWIWFHFILIPASLFTTSANKTLQKMFSRRAHVTNLLRKKITFKRRGEWFFGKIYTPFNLPLHYNVQNIFLRIVYFSQEYQRTPSNLKQICRSSLFLPSWLSVF